MQFIEQNNNVATVVIVGTWNFGIFTPNWVKENVLADEKDVTVLYPSAPLLSLKYVVSDKYNFAINGNRLEFQLMSNTEEASRNILTPIRNILRCLVYTPIQSFGINFLFSCNGMAEQIANIGSTQKLSKFMEDTFNGSLENLELTRSYKLTDVNTLNLKVYQKAYQTNVDFNFSYLVNSCKGILDILDSEDIINAHRKNALSILKSMYDGE